MGDHWQFPSGACLTFVTEDSFAIVGGYTDNGTDVAMSNQWFIYDLAAKSMKRFLILYYRVTSNVVD